MKAVRMYKPGDLRVEEVPIPVPGDGEVLLKIMAVGVCGSDIPRVLTYGAHVSPIIPGHEFSAEISQLGTNTGDWKVGDRVTCPPLIPCNKCEWCEKGLYSLCEDYDYFGSRRDGAFAQYLVSPITQLLKLPDNVSYEDAATMDPCANAMHGIAQGGVKEGDIVCVYGTGPIGLFACQCAKAKGAKMVIGVDVSQQKLDVALKSGCDYVFNSIEQNAPEEIKKVTNGEGADVVIDFTGAPPAQLAAIESARKMGKVVFLGISHKGLNLEEKHVDTIMRSQLSIIGSWNSFTKPFPGDDWFTPLKWFEEGKLSAAPIISHKLTLDECPDIFMKIKEGGLFFNKIMFYPNGEC